MAWRRYIAPVAAGAVLFVVLLILGFWQLDRAQEKRALLAGFADAQAQLPHPVDSASALAALSRFDPVQLRGRYVPDRQALLDVQMHRGEAGYRVWTPLALTDGTWVLVDRGWVPAGVDRSVLPDIEVGATARTVRGFVSPLPRAGLRLGQFDAGDTGWPRRLAWPDGDDIRRTWDRPLPPRIVLLAPDEPDGFVRDWNPVVEMPPERHVGYAVQWFALAAALVTIFGVLVLRRRKGHDGR